MITQDNLKCFTSTAAQHVADDFKGWFWFFTTITYIIVALVIISIGHGLLHPKVVAEICEHDDFATVISNRANNTSSQTIRQVENKSVYNISS